MVRALGYSSNRFDVRHPGRLCRGRERWIEPWEEEAKAPEAPRKSNGARAPLNSLFDTSAEPPTDDAKPDPEDRVVQRIVVSGAEFSDDSAADARRGLPFSGVDMASVITSLFPRRTLLAFMEDGHPADIPPDAEGIEAYEGYRAGGTQQLGMVRWHIRVTGVNSVRMLLGSDGPPDERLRGFAVVDAQTDDDALMDRIFTLVGFSTLDSPPARYQPAAIPAALELTKALVLLHRDKHGPALGLYATGEIPKLAERLGRLCDREGSLLVPFAIPPMLARWDRALSELRAEWMKTREEEFPVPPSLEPHPRERRRDRRGRDKRAAAKVQAGAEE